MKVVLVEEKVVNKSSHEGFVCKNFKLFSWEERSVKKIKFSLHGDISGFRRRGKEEDDDNNILWCFVVEKGGKRRDSLFFGLGTLFSIFLFLFFPQIVKICYSGFKFSH